jgi:ricin-type beta-trefoil lectin protein
VFPGDVSPRRSRRRRTKVVTFALAVLSLAAAYLTVISTVGPAPTASAAVDPSVWYTATSVNSGKCVDARTAGTTNGTVVQQFTCNSAGSQQWQFQPTDSGYYRVNNLNNSALAWDVTNVSTADGGLIQLWTYSNGNNQQWMPVQEASGAYHFVSRNSGKCLDVPGASTADSQQLQQFTCNASGAQSFTLAPVGSQPPPPPGNIDLGPNVFVFDPSMSQASIQSRLTSVFNQQQTNQFGSNRYALLFKPGSYNVDANVGFFTQVAGLGLSPDNVNINGGVHAEADWFPPQNATQNFWRSAENLSVTPPSGTDRWAVSQAAPYRRMHVKGNLALDDGGWASGGWMSDTKVDGQVRSGTQQQWISRNTTWGSWTGSNWNMVFVGSQNAPAGNFPSPPYTRVTNTPVVREKPFLYVDNAGNYNVFVPALRQNTNGITWAGTQPGVSQPIDQYFIVKPGATAAQINAALASGKNLLVTPGVYHLNQTINVTRPDTVILGLGLATFVPDGGITAMNVADVDGVKLAGLLIDAGTTNSQTLMQVGPAGSSADHTANPTSLSDVFFRIGGAGVGKATQSLVLNSNNVIGDHTWMWRADHGSGVGWNSNTAQNGLVVNGNNVTFYGLFVEHFQQYNVIWNGNGGRTYFFQNELPYDPPNQASYMNGATRGWAAYKVGANVTSHEAWGLGSYCFFSSNSSVVADRSFEVPSNPNVKLHDMVTVSLGGTGTIAHIVNNTGGPSNSGSNVANLVNFP